MDGEVEEEGGEEGTGHGANPVDPDVINRVLHTRHDGEASAHGGVECAAGHVTASGGSHQHKETDGNTVERVAL